MRTCLVRLSAHAEVRHNRQGYGLFISIFVCALSKLSQFRQSIMPTPYHILVEGNPALIFASRGGSPDKVLPVLNRFLEKFWRERETFGEYVDTPECLVAQLTVRFGFETAEDDFSNIRVGVKFNPKAEYLYAIGLDKTIQVWTPDDAYLNDPELGLKGCRLWKTE